MDVIISLAWFAAFGILVNALNRMPCGGVFQWGNIRVGRGCSRWKAAEAFSFLSAVVWLVSGFVVCIDPPLHRIQLSVGSLTFGNRVFGSSTAAVATALQVIMLEGKSYDLSHLRYIFLTIISDAAHGTAITTFNQLDDPHYPETTSTYSESLRSPCFSYFFYPY